MPIQLGDHFTQVVNKTKLYFTHYALFEEPDDNVPDAVYVDAATGQPTQELEIVAPIYQRAWSRKAAPKKDVTAPTQPSGRLPYFVDPPGFPPLPAPPQVIAAIAAATGAPNAVVTANTKVLLVAIGQFLAEGETSGEQEGDHFVVRKTMRFQVRIRTGFLFSPPGGGRGFGVLTGYLTMGLLHQLIQLPPPSNPDEVVVYDWKANLELSTRNSYLRPIAGEPRPVADAFDPSLTAIRFDGQKLDDAGRYTIVGFARPADVTFNAPPELEQFLFQTSQLTDVEFACSEEGVLVP